MRKLFGIVGLLGMIAWAIGLGLVLWSAPKLLSTAPVYIGGFGSFWAIMLLLYVARWPMLSGSTRGYLAIALLLFALGPVLVLVFGGLLGFIGIMLFAAACVMLLLKGLLGRGSEKPAQPDSGK